MRVLVTGGCGFIGYHLAFALTKRGDEVFVVDNLSGVGAAYRAGGMGRTGVGLGKDGTIRLPYLVGRDGQYIIAVSEFCDWYAERDYIDVDYAGAGIDAIFHLAAVPRTVPAIERPDVCMAANVMGSVDILEFARKCSIPRVVMSSSNVVYAADTPYKASKLMMEEACKAYHETYGVSVVCLRYSNVYGPGFAKGDPACLAAMRDSLVDRGYLEITGDGKQTRDFTHVDDIVAGNLAAVQSEYCGTVDLCTGRNVSMNEAAHRLWVLSKGHAGRFLDSVKRIPDRRGDCKHIVQDPRPAKEILGWEAKVKFGDGVKDVWRY